jgi:hypothetical protein
MCTTTNDGGVASSLAPWPDILPGAPNFTVLVGNTKVLMATAAWLGSVPFDVDVKVPVRLQLGLVTMRQCVGHACSTSTEIWCPSSSLGRATSMYASSSGGTEELN